MNFLNPRRIRRGIVAAFGGGLTLLALAAIAPMSTQASLLCTETIRGPHSGLIIVESGQKVCLDGAVQDGAVDVNSGGALSVVNSSIITGAVTLKSGFDDLRFCDSKTVRGAISATGSEGFVHIGGNEQALDCGPNSIDGAVILDANKGEVMLANNDITGEVVASGNLGGPRLAGTMISGNQIGGALTCSDNTPPPNNAGVSNAVSGDRAGQTCSVLTF